MPITITKYLVAFSLVAISASTLISQSSSSATEGSVSPFKIVNAKTKKKSKIVIVGGGTAGIGVAAMLRNEGMENITVVEPKDSHFYQPLWTLVGAGIKNVEKSTRDMQDILPRGVVWEKKTVVHIEPGKNTVTFSDSTTVEYDYLVIAAGIQIDWDQTPGLLEGLKEYGSGVVSIYDFTYAAKTWKEFNVFNKGNEFKMIFTVPKTPVKCAGAPQKIMWLLSEAASSSRKHRHDLPEAAKIEFCTPSNSLFPIKRYDDKLQILREERGVDAQYNLELVSVDVTKKLATFRNTETGKLQKKAFDLLHVTPNMSAPDFLKKSELAGKNGWMEVDKHTLQSVHFRNVFGVGDCIDIPTGKSAAAITAQAPVLVHNLLKEIDGAKIDGFYDGYTSCPLIISNRKAFLFEFGYDGKIKETFSRETGKFPLSLVGFLPEGVQQRFFYVLKAHILPFAYWNFWARGRWFGPSGIWKPNVVTKRGGNDDAEPPSQETPAASTASKAR